MAPRARRGRPSSKAWTRLSRAAPSGGAFALKWKDIAATEPDAFFHAQHNYIQRTHYDPGVQTVLNNTGLDVNSRSKAVQDVVWSMAVQHGAAPSLVTQAVQEVGPQNGRSDLDYDRALINQPYAVRNAYVVKIGQPNLQNRYVSE